MSLLKNTLKQILKSSSLLLLILLVSGCAHNQLEDEPICTEITPERGFCVNIVSGKSFEVNETNKYKGKTWWEMRPANIAVPPSTWAALKKFIIKFCKQTNSCDAHIRSWDRSIQIIDDRAQQRLP